MMIAQGFTRLVNIEMPVTDTVKDVCHSCGIIQSLCDSECLLKVFTRLGVVACCPEEAEINQRLPLHIVITTHLGFIKHDLKILLCRIKVAKGFILMAASAI